MGRPRKSEPRDRQLNLSLTASELQGIERRALVVGMRPVHFGRALLLDPLRGAAIAKVTPADNTNRLIHGQLIRLGNNLNQLVRRLHQLKEPLPADLAPLLRDIRLLIARLAP